MAKGEESTERVWTRSQVAHILGIREATVQYWKKDGQLLPSYPASLPVSGNRMVDGYTRSDLEKAAVLAMKIKERQEKFPPPPGYVEIATVAALFQVSECQAKALIAMNDVPHYYYKPQRAPVTVYKYADILELFERCERLEKEKAREKAAARKRREVRKNWKKKLNISPRSPFGP